MVGTVEQEYEPTSVEEKQERRNEMKARATLLMALPNKDQLKFHTYQDAKLLMEAIEKRYGGNKESKKVQRTLLKQQYENFAALSSESIDQTFDRLQKLIGQLEIQGEVINQEDMNLKLLRIVPSEKEIYEPELTGSSSTSQNTQNVAFVSNNTNNTNSTHKADDSSHEISTTQSTTHTHHNGSNTVCLDNLCDAVICAFLASQPNCPQLSQEDLEQLHPDDLEEMDLQWEMAMLTIRARRFIKRTGKKLNINGQRVGFKSQKLKCLQLSINHGTLLEIYQAEEEQLTNHALMAFTSSGSSSNSECEVDSCSKTCVKAYASLKEQYDNLSSDYKNIDKFKKGLGYNAATAASPAVEGFVNLTDKSGTNKACHAVSPPLTGNFIPHKPDLTFIDEIMESENLDVTTVLTPSNDKTVADRDISNTVESNAVRIDNTSAPIIED
ncbi:hypothetical protein Tco_0139095 [Tanacetum coccineum]